MSKAPQGPVIVVNGVTYGSRAEIPTRRLKLLQAVICGFLIGWMALFLCGLWKGPRLVFDSSNGLLYILLALLNAPWVLMIAGAYRTSRRRSNLLPDPDPPQLKHAGTALVGLAVIVMINYFAVFAGAAKLLHYAERQPGETTAVITAKHGYPSKRCSPRIELRGFRFAANHLCVPREFFDRVKVGDRIRITGTMSAYAMEPERFEVVADTGQPK